MNNIEFFFYLKYDQIEIVAFDTELKSIIIEKKIKDKIYYNDEQLIINFDQTFKEVIIEIEKRLNRQLSIINLIIDSPFTYKINGSIKKNFDGLKISKNQIQYLIQDLKQQIAKTSDNLKINHVLINEVSMNGKKIDFLPINMSCSDLIFSLEFICFPKSLIYPLENFFKNHQIKFSSTLCGNYVESFKKDGFKNSFEAAIALKNDYNLNEVSIISKKTVKMGFFERIFHIFS